MQKHGLDQRSEYEKRRRDSLETIAASFDEEALIVIDRALAIASLPFGEKNESTFKALLEIAETDAGDHISSSYKFHALEARLALLSLPEISSEVERFRELATYAGMMNPEYDEDNAF
jgi:hypothetical protein